jgi:hypothetical protein
MPVTVGVTSAEPCFPLELSPHFHHQSAQKGHLAIAPHRGEMGIACLSVHGLDAALGYMDLQVIVSVSDHHKAHGLFPLVGAEKFTEVLSRRLPRIWARSKVFGFREEVVVYRDPQIDQEAGTGLESLVLPASCLDGCVESEGVPYTFDELRVREVGLFC